MAEEFEASSFAALMAIDQKAKKKQNHKSRDDKVTKLQNDNNTNKQDDDVTDIFDYIRKVVKEDNKEVSPFRISANEKDFLFDVLYILKKKYKFKSDATKVTRIALTYLLSDFKANGKNSILVNTLERIEA